MPSLVTVLTSPSNYTTSLRNRTQFPSINSDGGGGGDAGGGGSGISEGIEQNTEAILPNFLPDSFDLPATFSPPGVGNLLASGSNAVYYEETSLSSSSSASSSSSLSSFEFFEDAAEFFNSPLPFDASENGLFNGRFVPPPPRPPFLMDEPVITDGLTTCDLCSWAMPTKSTFIFEGTIEKASELGWPLTLIIVSILSAILGAIIMITVVRCKRKKSSNNRNETHVQWWSRNKRPNNNNHLRRSNIYTAHPADSIRGLNGQQQQQPPLPTPIQQQQQLHQQATLQPQESQLYQQQHNRHNHNHYPHPPHQQQQQHHHHHHQQQHQDQPQHQQQHPNHLTLQHHSSNSLTNMTPTTDTCNWPNVSTLVVPS